MNGGKGGGDTISKLMGIVCMKTYGREGAKQREGGEEVSG